MIDSHCHLDFYPTAEVSAVIKTAATAGIHHCLVPGVSPKQWQNLPGLRAANPNFVSIAVGCHPAFLGDFLGDPVDNLADQLRAFASQNAVSAIGEFGFDERIAKSGGASFPAQREAAVVHQSVAHELSLPIIVHVVGAHQFALDHFKEHRDLFTGGVIHQFSGSADVAKQWLNLGFHLSFGLTLTNPQARKVKEALLVVPKDRLLIETDAPDGRVYRDGSEPDRSQSYPSDLGKVQEAAARLLRVSEHELAIQTSANAQRLFRLNFA